MATSESKFNTSLTSVCPRCGTGLRCGMVAGDAECWCAQLPHVIAVPASPATASCFCPGCLKQITAERRNAVSPASLAPSTSGRGRG